MTRGSLQLRQFLAARRDGVDLVPAATDAGMSMEEARLTEAERIRGHLDDILSEMPCPSFKQPTEAAAARAIQRDSVNGCRDQGDVHDQPMDRNASPTPMEVTMPKHDEPAAPPADDFDPLIELAAETLRGDIRDSLLDWFKAQPKSWPFMVEREQRELADAADRYARMLIQQACKIIAAGERPTIVAKLVEYREKDGVEAKLRLPSTGEVVAALHEACGREVLVVTSGAEDFMEQRADAVIDPDQRPIRGIGDEYDEAA